MITTRIVVIVILLFLTFVYGMAVGRYEVFPYSQIIELRDWYRGDATDERQFEDVDVYDTSLTRLLVKRIEIEEDYSRNLYVRGGAIASKDQFLYLHTNRNDEFKERLVVFDTEQFERVETGGLSIPMNLDQLMDSPLMDIDGFAFDRFRVNGMHVEKMANGEHILYVSHTFYHPDERCITSNVSKVTLMPGDLRLKQTGEWETLLTAEPCMYPEDDQHNYEPFSGQMSGGPIVNYDEEHLLVSVGSFHREGLKYESLTMDNTSPFGSFILLNKHSGDYTIYAKGIRNSQGLYKDYSGRIWATDHGPQGGDELNIVREGKNFGWPEVSYGIDYGNNPWPLAEEQGRHDRFDQPVYVWMPSIATTNIIGITGQERFPLWAGDLLVGSLRGQSIYRLRIQGDDRIIYSEEIRLGRRIRDLTTLQNGAIALLTDDGMLMIIDDGGPVYNETGPVVEARVSELNRYDNLRGKRSGERADGESVQTGENLFMQQCSSCHYLQEINGVGPHLKDIFDRRVGEAEGFNYSESFNENNEQWSTDLMKNFLLNPSDYFPNSTMPEITLTEEEVNMIIEYLK